MKPLRAIAIMLAWVPVVVAAGLIVEYTRRTCPDFASTLAKMLYGTREPDPDVRYVSRFDDEADLEKWYRTGAQLVLSGKWGEMTFKEGRGLPGIRLFDYRNGPGGVRDWSRYCILKWGMRCPQPTDQKLQLILKDSGNKRYETSFPIPRGGPDYVSLDLREMVPYIDLTHVAEVHYYMKNPEVETVVYLKDLRLEKAGCAPGEVLGEPFVVFDKLMAPETAKLGEAVNISASLSLLSPARLPYWVFLHLYPESERREPVPARRKGYIHFERIPFVPVTEWPVGLPVDVGTFTVYFPTGYPSGKYLISLGLYNPLSQGEGPRDVAYTGAFDYGGSFPKCRYTDPSIEDFVVGSIMVEGG